MWNTTTLRFRPGLVDTYTPVACYTKVLQTCIFLPSLLERPVATGIRHLQSWCQHWQHDLLFSASYLSTRMDLNVRGTISAAWNKRATFPKWSAMIHASMPVEQVHHAWSSATFLCVLARRDLLAIHSLNVSRSEESGSKALCTMCGYTKRSHRWSAFLRFAHASNYHHLTLVRKFVSFKLLCEWKSNFISYALQWGRWK